MTQLYRKHVLGNGLTLVVERHPHVRSASIGVWVKVGSGIESPEESGLSHCIEHMTFKGTQKRSALQIATALESVGGELNAFTDREVTCYHATVLSEHIEQALEVLSDLTLNPSFPKDEFEKEKRVLLQELAMIQESPDEQIHELFFKEVWKEHGLGQPVIGNRKTINSFTRNSVIRFFKKYYRPDNMIVSIAGNVDFSQVVESVEKYFVGTNEKTAMKSAASDKKLLRSPKFNSFHKKAVTESDQLHLVVGFDGLSVSDPQRYDALILNFYLGGGMSSRLFQEIREKAGLAYTVDCDFVPFRNTGLFLVYLAMVPKSLPKVVDILAKELISPSRELLDDAQLNQVKGQIRGAILLSADQMESRQESLGRNELLFGRLIPVEEVISQIEKVTPESVRAVSERIFVAKNESTITLSKIKPKMKEVSLFHG